jgi:hypothetical protein
VATQGIVSPRSSFGGAGLGETVAIISNGQRYTSVLNLPGIITTETWRPKHDYWTNVFSDPGSPGAGPGGYCWLGQEIYVLSAPPAWTLDFTVTLQNATGNYDGHTGLTYVRGADDKRYLAGFCAGATTTDIVVVWLDLENISAGWTQRGYNVALSATSGRAVNSCVAHQGMLWTTDGQHAYSWNPVTKTVSRHVTDTSLAPSDNYRYARLVEVWGRLFLLAVHSNNFRIYERHGGVFLLSSTVAGCNQRNGHFGVFNTAGSFYVFFSCGTGGQGIRHYRCQATSSLIGQALNIQEFTNPVIPVTGTQGSAPFPAPWPDGVADWRYPASLINHQDTRIVCMGLNANPASGVMSSVLVYFMATAPPAAPPQPTIDVFSYAGTATFMSQLTPFPLPGTGFFEDEVFPSCLSGSEENTLQPGVNVVQITKVEREDSWVAGGLRIYFFCPTNGTQTNLSIAFYYHDPSSDGGPTTFNKCTLVANSGWGQDQFATQVVVDTVNNRCTSVTGENNGGAPPPTLYSVVWDRVADGMPLDQWGKIEADFEP